jgi:hypothetical protein
MDQPVKTLAPTPTAIAIFSSEHGETGSRGHPSTQIGLKTPGVRNIILGGNALGLAVIGVQTSDYG